MEGTQPARRLAVTVSLASRRQRVTIENLMQLYVHDFSALWAGEERDDGRGDVGPDGRFAPYPLERYWRDRRCFPFLIHADARIAGFILVDSQSHSGLPVDRNVAEFFVLRTYRRRGVGAAAAHAVFAGFPGHWEAAVVRRNVAALAFWRRTIAGCARATRIEEIDRDGPDWDGPILRFRIDAEDNGPGARWTGHAGR
jgi:predicted acetyltransferase